MPGSPDVRICVVSAGDTFFVVVTSQPVPGEADAELEDRVEHRVVLRGRDAGKRRGGRPSGRHRE